MEEMTILKRKKNINLDNLLPSTPPKISKTNETNSIKLFQSDFINYGLPDVVVKHFQKLSIRLFKWQKEAIEIGIKNNENLIIVAPTSSGKTMVPDILLIRTVHKRKKKVLVVLPYISLANEKVVNLETILKFSGINVGGFMGNCLPAGRFDGVDIAVCTIEKANNIINRLIEDGKLNDLGLIVVDELHELSGERGVQIEQLLTKVKYHREVYGNDIQIVGMSATLPNYDEIAKWLVAKFYCTDYRPIMLKEMIKIGDSIKDVATDTEIRKFNDLAIKIRNDSGTLSLALETIITGNGVLVFCTSKDSTEKFAAKLANTIQNLMRYSGKEEKFKHARDRLKQLFNQSSIEELKFQLSKCPSKLDANLDKTLPSGIAFHHAGLSMEERDIIESGFKEGIIKCIFATPTLSSGVNLPARRVIISSIKTGKDFMNKTVYQQMRGRAGRKGIDIAGESILICENENQRPKCLELISNGLEKIVSFTIKLDKNGKVILTESLRRITIEAIANGLARTYDEIKNYLNSTFFASQLRPLTDEEVKMVLTNLCSSTDSNILPVIQRSKDKDKEIYEPSRLGEGILASSFSPDEAIKMLKEIKNAMNGLALNTDLHLLYLVIPSTNVEGKKIDWNKYSNFFEAIERGTEYTLEKNVTKLIGLNYGYVVNEANQGNIIDPDKKLKYTKFYYTLALNEIMNEKPLHDIAHKYNIPRGDLQILQQRTSSFCGMLHIFCKKLGYNILSLITRQFKDRLYFGISSDLIELMEIPCLNGQIARCLYDNDFKDVKTIAYSTKKQIERCLIKYFSCKEENEKSAKAKKVWIPVKCKSMTEGEIADLILKEARAIIEENAGCKLQWSSNKSDKLNESKIENNLDKSNQLSKSNKLNESKIENNLDKSNQLCRSNKLNESKIENNLDKSNQLCRSNKLNESKIENNLNNSNQPPNKSDKLNESKIENNLNNSNQPNKSVIINNKRQYKNFKSNARKRQKTNNHTEQDKENYFIIESPIESEENLNDTSIKIESTIKKLDDKLFYESNYNKEFDLECFEIIHQQASIIYQSINKNEFNHIVHFIKPKKMNKFIEKFKRSKLFSIHFEMEEMLIRESDYLNNKCKEVQDVKVQSSFQDKILSICLLFGDGEMYYLKREYVEIFKNALRNFEFQNKLVTVISFDSKFSYKMLKRVFDFSDNCLSKINWHDLKIAHWLLNSDADEPAIITEVAEKYLNEEIVKAADFFKKLKVKRNDSIFAQTKLLYPVMSKLKQLLQERKLYECYINIEIPVLIIFADMELNGMSLDEDYLDKASSEWMDLISKLEGKHPKINFRTPEHVIKLLNDNGLYKKYIEKFDLPKSLTADKIKSRKEVLERMLELDSELPSLIINIRKLYHVLYQKDDFLKEKFLNSNIVMGTYRHFMATGRIAMYNPNLLAVDKDFDINLDNNEIYKVSLKKSFIAKPGYVFVTADFCQLELRILAALSKEKNLIDVFNLDQDPFKLIASKIKNKKPEDITQFERNSTKQIIYSIIYGVGLKSLTENLGVHDENIAFEFLNEFHKAFPKLQPFIDKSKIFCQENGYAETIFGRRRYIPEIYSTVYKDKSSGERKAVNSRIQGSASDLVKLTMLKIDQNLKRNQLDAKFLLQIHDELIFEVKNDKETVNMFVELLTEEMSSCGSVINTKLSIKVKTGFNWSELKEFELDHHLN